LYSFIALGTENDSFEYLAAIFILSIILIAPVGSGFLGISSIAPATSTKFQSAK